MANGQAFVYAKKPDNTGLAIAAAVGLGGVAILWLMSQGKGAVPSPPGGGTPGAGPAIGGSGPVDRSCLSSMERISDPASASIVSAGIIGKVRGVTIDVVQPVIQYQGPGRNLYTSARIVQNQGWDPIRNVERGWITVYGSGIAGIYIPASPTPKLFALVPSSPISTLGGTLTMYPFPGPPNSQANQICGWDAYPGKATLLIEVFGLCRSSDGADGFASVTCNGRSPLARYTGTDKILFV